MHPQSFEEFELPSPKKRRLNTEATQAATNPDGQDDDMEDVYTDTPPATQSNVESTGDQEKTVATEPPLATAGANAAFTLPGLGGGEAEGETDAPTPHTEQILRGQENEQQKTTGEEAQAEDKVMSEPGQAEATAVPNEAQPKPIDAGTHEQKPEEGALNIEDSNSGETIKQEAAAPNPSVKSENGFSFETVKHEAALPEATVGAPPTNEDQNAMETFDDANGSPPAAGPEWEADSSQYESSSSDISSDTTSEDSDDSDGSEEYQLLDPTEQARRLMEDVGGSDNEGGTKSGGKGAVVRTHNEKPDEVVEKPDIEVTLDMKIEELGNIESVVYNIALIKAKTTGEYQVLESGSLLCLDNRKVIGVVSETLGRVQEPLYCVRFPNPQIMENDGVVTGATIYYVPDHSTYVFTKVLQGMKGSDASNVHDEEVAEDEMEFSDDEAEAEYRRNLKLQKQAKRAEKAGITVEELRNTGRGRNQGRRNVHDGDMGQGNMEGINYDDAKDGDGELYTPLARPTNLQEIMNRGGPTAEFPRERDGFSRPSRGGRGRGDRGRGDRGRGGRHGKGGRKDFGGRQQQQSQRSGLDLSLPPTPKFSGVPPIPRPGVQAPPLPPVPQPPPYMAQPHNQQSFQPPAPYQHNQFQFQPPQPQGQYVHNQWHGQPQPHFPPPQQGQANPYQFQPHFQQPNSQYQQPGSQFQAGAFVNPAFFAQFQQQQNPGYSGPPAGSGQR